MNAADYERLRFRREMDETWEKLGYHRETTYDTKGNPISYRYVKPPPAAALSGYGCLVPFALLAVLVVLA